METELARKSFVPEQHTLLKKIADLYFEPKSFEREGRAYELVGIKRFKRELLTLISKFGGRIRENETNGSNYYIGSDLSIDSIKRFEAQTRINEVIHVVCVSPAVYFAIDGFANGDYFSGLASVAIALPQLYVIGLQRYNRARIYDLVNRMEN